MKGSPEFFNVLYVFIFPVINHHIEQGKMLQMSRLDGGLFTPDPPDHIGLKSECLGVDFNNKACFGIPDLVKEDAPGVVKHQLIKRILVTTFCEPLSSATKT
jgi:hypothetical protein